MNTIKPYRDEVVRQIKEAGQELIDRAESLVGNDLDMITGVYLQIDIGNMSNTATFPEITIHTSIATKSTLSRWYEEG